MSYFKYALLTLYFLFSASLAANELSLGRSNGSAGETAAIPLALSSENDIEAFVASFDWDGSVAQGVDLVPEPALDTSDIVITRIEADFAVLGVIVDSDGIGESAVPAGSEIPVATLLLRCSDTPGSSDVTFVDGLYATVPNGLLLNNLLVLGGRSIDVSDGVLLTDGFIESTGPAERFYVAPADESDDSSARILMENGRPVEGYVVSVCHDPAALSLREIVPGEDAVEASVEFISTEILDGGGVFSVILDIESPFEGQTIRPGPDRHIATYHYDCLQTEESLQSIQFCDGFSGDKDNVIVVGGRSFHPILEDGEVSCGSDPCTPEDCANGVDDDCDGLIDLDDPGCDLAFLCGSRDSGLSIESSTIVTSIGATTEVCFFLQTSEDDAVGQAEQFDQVQGLSMALEHDCRLQATDELDIGGTLVEAIGAEFVSLQVDNNPDDGDGCELIIGILVDALPPFDGATIPPLGFPQRIGCVPFSVDDDPDLCGSCLLIDFVDGVDGTSNVPTQNLVSAENTARPPRTEPCEICVVNEPQFFRGDCNYSGGSTGAGLAVDIGDAAALTRFMFFPPELKLEPPCLDACDCNDDGRLDVADTLCMLRYLFDAGTPPRPPGPGIAPVVPGEPLKPTPPGRDPTPDTIGCEAGEACF